MGTSRIVRSILTILTFDGHVKARLVCNIAQLCNYKFRIACIAGERRPFRLDSIDRRRALPRLWNNSCIPECESTPTTPT